MSDALADPAPWDVVVVGAGISGLVAAHQLRRAHLRVQVVDAAGRAGGVIATVTHQGCQYECGPNSAMDTTPLIGELVATLGLGEALRFASEVSHTRYVVRGGVPMALPMSPAAFLGTRLFSWRAKAALLREPFVARAAPGVEESIAAFVRRRLGSEIGRAHV